MIYHINKRMEFNYGKILREKIGHMAILSPVVTLVIYKDGKILLQRRNDNGTWAIHGGGIEPGEKYLETLMREIKEELNIVPINPVLMGIYSGKELFNTYPSGDQVFVLNHVFFCEDYEGTLNFNDGEVEDVKWFSLDDLPDNLFKVNQPIIYDIQKFIDSGKKPIVN